MKHEIWDFTNIVGLPMRITLGLLNFFRTSSTWTPTFFPINVFLEKTWWTKQYLKRKKEDIPLMKKSIREIPERWQHSERREWQIRSERELRCRCQRRCRRRCRRRRKQKRSEAGTEKCQSGKCLRPEKIKKRVICNFFHSFIHFLLRQIDLFYPKPFENFFIQSYFELVQRFSFPFSFPDWTNHWHWVVLQIIEDRWKTHVWRLSYGSLCT